MRDTSAIPFPDAARKYQDSGGIEAVSVVIVGVGPTGLTAGNLLGMAGIDTLILERNASVSDYPKAIALDDEGLRICQAMGLDDAVSKCILPDIHAHYVSEGRLFAKVAPSSKRNGHPLISTFNQPEFEATLLEGLKRFKCVNTRFQSTVEAFEQTGSKVMVSFRTPSGALQTVMCSYLLACDGGSSTIRRMLDIPMRGTTFAQKWLVVDVITDEEPVPIAMFFCNPERPAVTVPSPRRGRRWEFMLRQGETEKELLEEKNITTLIQQAGGSPPSGIMRKTIYTFHATLAENFSKGRVFLLGDAAHMMPPFGGQGLNSGLRDAHNLTWKLSMCLRGQASKQLLDTYHEERHRHVAQMIRFSSFLGNIVMTRKRFVAYGRDIIFRLINHVPAIREYLTEARIKPQPRYQTGFLLSGGERKHNAVIGQMLPQPWVTTAQGQHVLLDEVLGTGFALLRLHHNPNKAFASLKTDFWEWLGARFVCVRPCAAGKQGRGIAQEEFSYDREHETMVEDMPPLAIVQANDMSFPDYYDNLFVVVRPDRYILGVFREEEADLFVSAFKGLLQKQM
jgi:3-(3-hydroxy-phenyl)propionate hydroxylase